jgi:hypothetical protein
MSASLGFPRRRIDRRTACRPRTDPLRGPGSGRPPLKRPLGAARRGHYPPGGRALACASPPGGGMHVQSATGRTSAPDSPTQVRGYTDTSFQRRFSPPPHGQLLPHLRWGSTPRGRTSARSTTPLEVGARAAFPAPAGKGPPETPAAPWLAPDRGAAPAPKGGSTPRGSDACTTACPSPRGRPAPEAGSPPHGGGLPQGLPRHAMAGRGKRTHARSRTPAGSAACGSTPESACNPVRGMPGRPHRPAARGKAPPPRKPGGRGPLGTLPYGAAASVVFPAVAQQRRGLSFRPPEYLRPGRTRTKVRAFVRIPQPSGDTRPKRSGMRREAAGASRA